MKTYFTSIKTLLIIITFSISFGCSNDDNNSNTSSDLTGGWKVICFIEDGVKITKSDANTWPDINNGDITANFTNTGFNGQGELSGITVSNSYNANFTISSNGQIEIEGLISTLIEEPEWTRLYRIDQAESYELNNDQLIIYYNSKNNSIIFERN